MSIKTIHCRLTAPEPVRRHLWHLMSERNTPLVNELLKLVSQHPEFEDWQRKGTVPEKVVQGIWQATAREISWSTGPVLPLCLPHGDVHL